MRGKMSRRAMVLSAIQFALVVCVLAMTIWTKMAWLACVGVAVVGFSAIASAGLFIRQTNSARDYWLIAAWAGTLTVPAAMGFASGRPFTVDDYQAILAWMMAAVTVPACHFGRKTSWKLLVATWIFAGCFIWLTEAYAQNHPGSFYEGLLITLACLIGCKFWFRMTTLATVACNTVILLLVGVPIADVLGRPDYHLPTHPDVNSRYYSYESAKRDPATFARWWDFYREEFGLMAARVFIHNAKDVVPFRLKPESESRFFESVVSINSKGFRGREIPEQKADTYRIVVLGESTTFGMTLTAEDRPWPEVLEELIHQRLKPKRPVQVINAGVPAYSILDNLHRLAGDILPLKPDMIISYHGVNGFDLIDPRLPGVRGTPPAYRPRPLWLLARCEYRLKVMWYRRHLSGKGHDFQSRPDPLESRYALAYRELIQCAQTNGIRLVLSNFSMAVNIQSDSDVIEFYRLAFPSLISQIQVNAIHSRIVNELAAQQDRVLFVDTHSNLDGSYEKFIDVIHFTQEGRQQLAENMFVGIKKTLEGDLASSP